MTKRTTAHYFLEGLHELGIEYLFSNLGTDHVPLIEEMARWQRDHRKHPQVILCPHENVAVHMAGGYAMCTGRGQAVLVHVDAGTANAALGLHNLFRARVPILLVAGKAPYTIRGELPGSRDATVHFLQGPYDMASIVRPYVKWEYDLPSGVVAKEALRRAHAVMHSDPMGPTYLTVAREVLTAEWDEDAVASFGADRYGPVTAVGCDDATILEMTDRLLAARNPILITGYAGRNPECPAVIDELARLAGMRVYESNPLLLNVSHDSPCFTGFLPGRDLGEADFGLLVDVDIPWIPKFARENHATQWVHVDIDAIKKDFPMWGFPTHLRVQADSYRVLKRLVEALRLKAGAPYREAARRRLAEWTKRHETRDAEIRAAATDRGAPGRIAPAYLCAELDRVMGQDDVLVNEAITNAPIVCTQIRRTRPGTFLGLPGSGLGFGGGAALGAKLAHPDRTIFHLTGDGSFYFSTPTSVYAVARQYGLPIFTVILDNAGWSAVKGATLRVYPDGAAQAADEFQARLAPEMRFEKLAEMAGAYGERVEDPDAVPAAIGRCLEAVQTGRPAILVARVTPLQPAAWR